MGTITVKQARILLRAVEVLSGLLWIAFLQKMTREESPCILALTLFFSVIVFTFVTADIFLGRSEEGEGAKL